MYGAPLSPSSKGGNYNRFARDFSRHGSVRSNRIVVAVVLLLLIPTFYILRQGRSSYDLASSTTLGDYNGARARTDATRIAIVAFTTQPASYLFLTLKNRFHYAKKHGLDFYVDFDGGSSSRGTEWHKLDMVEAVIRQGTHDWVWYLDLEALIMNTDVDVRYIVRRALAQTQRPKDVDVIVSQDCNGFNVDSFLVRSHARSINILDATRFEHDSNPYLDDRQAFQHLLGQLPQSTSTISNSNSNSPPAAANSSSTATSSSSTVAKRSTYDPLRHVLTISQHIINGVPREVSCRERLGDDGLEEGRSWKYGDLVMNFAHAKLASGRDPVATLMKKYEKEIIWGQEEEEPRDVEISG